MTKQRFTHKPCKRYTHITILLAVILIESRGKCFQVQALFKWEQRWNYLVV